jgi:pimeloyl-ACP methyl ester carboxylesterase
VATYGPVDAPTLVLTHGAGANGSSWYYLLRDLAARFRLVVWDLPGLGHSRGPRNHDYSLEKHARDLEAVLDIAGEPVVLAGHSMGGMVLLTFCRLFPERLRAQVAGLALIDTSPTNPVRTTTASGLLRALQRPLLEPLLHLVVWLSPLVWLMNWLSYQNGTSHLGALLFGFAGSETRGQLDLAARYNAEASPAVLGRENLAMFRYDATEVLPRLSVPTLVVSGHLDRLIIPETARAMRDRLPDARLALLAPAGHMSVFERGAELAEAVGTFADAAFAARQPAAQAHTRQPSPDAGKLAS